jgi:multisubunit Na+/H+ antiporter MnhC subunit
LRKRQKIQNLQVLWLALECQQAEQQQAGVYLPKMRKEVLQKMIIVFCLLGMAVGVFVMAAGVAEDEEQEDKF